MSLYHIDSCCIQKFLRLVLLELLTLICYKSQSTIYYVNPRNYISDGGGRKWDQAFLTLDDALTTATKRNDEIWLIYNYTYYPSTNDRFDCFRSSIGVSIYGGFIGTETDKSQRIDSYFDLYPSIISGNIGNKDIATDNCYNVLTYQQEVTLDGLIISDGYANLEKYSSQEYVLNKYGGALITSDGSKKTQVSINNVIFRDNVALNGGALWFMSNNVNHVNVLITNCQFINNMAIKNDNNGMYEGGYGGAVYLYFMANITIINSEFIDNIAYHKAGAIYQDYGGILECNYCQFINNHVINGYGGALFAEDRNSQTEGTFPLIKNSYFYNNSATFYGGAICYFNDVIAVNFMNNSFISNKVYNGFGGAIALIGSQIIDLFENSNNNTFSRNKAILSKKTNILYNISYDEYDEIDINLTLNVTLYLKEIWDKYQLIMEETDIYPFSSSNEICYVDINNVNGINTGNSWNSAYQTIQECIDDLNEKPNGGEIWVSSGHYIPTSIPSWKINAGKTGNIHKSFILYENIRIYGGFNSTETMRSQRNFYSNPTYLTCELPSNTYCYEIVDAADNSLIDGFIFVKAQNQLKNNEMNRRRLSDTDSLSVLEILSSTAGNSGGGIYSNSTTITVVNSIFYKLFSSGKGGAIYCIGLQGYPSSLIKAPSIINSAFVGNRAAARGGAISGDVQCNFICKYCIFDSNSCSKKGGGIYLDFNSDPSIISSKFINNYALESGGCLAEDGESNTTFIGDTLFKDNWAKWEGGALYSGSGVGPGIFQGFIFDSNNITFDGNYLLNGNESGENNIYLWPYNIIDYKDITYSPTPQPTNIITSKPSISPTGNYTFNKPPNFIIFVVDDILYTKELNKSTNGAAAGTQLYHKNVSYLEIPLPNLEEFVSESIVFPRSYCGGPKCSPARFSILTGRHVSRSEFARHRTLQTSSGFFGTNITIQTSKLLYNDSIHNIPYELQKNNKYYTGMVGKWHLMSHDDNGYNFNCSILNYKSDPEIYEKCINIVKEQGFDFVDAYYHENININASYGHNPEWIISRAQLFINQSIEKDQPFFLYAAHTLTHDPTAYVSMFNFSINDTPKGILKGKEIPRNTGMHSRQYLWQKALDLGFSTSNRLNFAAMDIWVDDSFGALINYLKEKDLYDNTFIVVLNDHGMGSKGTLYEQGTRIWQFVRFPPIFGDNGHILTDDYITSPTDLASVIFDIANISNDIDPNYIMNDSKNWIKDVVDYIDNDNQENECCSHRFVDIHNSHSIITKDWKYIYRATDVVETEGDVCDFYIYCHDYQQLYYLPNDPNEQNNLIHDLNDSKIYNDILYDLQSLMVDYIQNVTCPIRECKAPRIRFTKSPSYDPTFNPTLNPTFNAKFNTTMNPKFTSTFNLESTQMINVTMIETNKTNSADQNKGDNNNNNNNKNNLIIIMIICGSIISLIVIISLIICIKRKKRTKIDKDDGYVRMVDMKDDGMNYSTKVAFVD